MAREPIVARRWCCALCTPAANLEVPVKYLKFEDDLYNVQSRPPYDTRPSLYDGKSESDFEASFCLQGSRIKRFCYGSQELVDARQKASVIHRCWRKKQTAGRVLVDHPLVKDDRRFRGPELYDAEADSAPGWFLLQGRTGLPPAQCRDGCHPVTYWRGSTMRPVSFIALWNPVGPQAPVCRSRSF